MDIDYVNIENVKNKILIDKQYCQLHKECEPYYNSNYCKDKCISKEINKKRICFVKGCINEIKKEYFKCYNCFQSSKCNNCNIILTYNRYLYCKDCFSDLF